MKTYLKTLNLTVLLLAAGGAFCEEFVRIFFATLSTTVGHGPITGAAAGDAATVALLAGLKLAAPLAIGILIKGQKGTPDNVTP